MQQNILIKHAWLKKSQMTHYRVNKLKKKSKMFKKIKIIK